MAEKLTLGARLPSVALKLLDGTTMTVPEDTLGRYLVLILYRGHWCRQCRRHLTTYQEHLQELDDLGVSVVAASVDGREETIGFRDSGGFTFPMAYGVTAGDVAVLDPWWGDDEHGHYIQPTEMLVLPDGTIHTSMYSSGSLGRMPVEGVLFAVRLREERRLTQA
jgi:peroxiredoxin